VAMHTLSSLLKDQPSLHESRMSTTGFCVWIVWSGELTSAIPNTFHDFGGMRIAEEQNQALWFFFSKDVFTALARLQVWANLNDLPVFLQAMPSALQVGFQLELSLSIHSELYSQQIMEPHSFQVLIHPDLRPSIEAIPGMRLTKLEHPDVGLSAASWSELHGDARMGFSSKLGWYFVIKPLGNSHDEGFVEGWRKFFGEIENVLKRLKVRYIVQNDNLICDLDSYGTLRKWCMEILSLLHRGKGKGDVSYWPSVMAAVEKDGYQFNEELPKKIPLDWAKLAPDFPHMSYRSAFLLGKPFHIKDVNYSFERSRFSDWCYLYLPESSEEELGGSLPMSLPIGFLAGKHRECFYCGMRNHTEKDCPSRKLAELSPETIKQLSRLDVEQMNEAYHQAGDTLKEKPLEGVRALLEGKEKPSLLTKSYFESKAVCQLRFLPLVWRAQGKNMPRGLEQLSPQESSPVEQAYNSLLAGDIPGAERLAKDAALHHPRDYKSRSLLGFIALERGDIERALSYWKEAESLGATPLHISYLKFVQGRANEVIGRSDLASTFYKDAQSVAPRWNELLYRQAVCMVRMGFSEHVVGVLDDLFERDPHMFNRLLMDPEIERGYLQILSHLWTVWSTAKAKAIEAKENLEELKADLDEWFGTEHEFNRDMQRRIAALLRLDGIENFVAFCHLSNGYKLLAKKKKARVESEVQLLEKKGKRFRQQLKVINSEISWFPFPRALREFNRDFNYCVTKLNWVAQQHFQVPRNFRRSHEYFEKVEDKLKRLGHRLITLKIIRDTTLFSLILGKSFMWIEIVCLGFALAAVPAAVYFLDMSQYPWLNSLVGEQKWSLQKGAVVIFSAIALVLSTIRTALVFEKKRRALFSKDGKG